jgi:hypothetical protein
VLGFGGRKYSTRSLACGLAKDLEQVPQHGQNVKNMLEDNGNIGIRTEGARRKLLNALQKINFSSHIGNRT